MGMGNESAGNLSPAPPQWTKGPGVSAGRSHRLTGACPTVVNIHLRKVDAARRIGSERTLFPAKSADSSRAGKNATRSAPVAKMRKVSSFGCQNSRSGNP
jgi:hypothetical protein